MDRRAHLELVIEEFDHKEEILELLTEYPSITWIDINTIKFGKRVGTGASAEVKEGVWNGSSVAVKVLLFIIVITFKY